jgi:hypothetical protein
MISTAPTQSAAKQHISDLAAAAMRPLVVVVLLAAALFWGFESRHWQMMIDSPIMHYVNFLIDHGRRPYTDITDNNMPGAYYTEGLAMRVFGAGDLAWRMYDYFLLTLMTAALVLIAKPYDWLAGYFAGGLFIAVHAAEGAKYLVEREEVLTVLLVLGYAAFFGAVRRRKPVWMLAFGFAGGLATSIKPTFLPLPLALMLLVWLVLRRRQIPAASYILWAFAGLAAAAALDLGYLLHYGVLQGFWFVLRTVSPTYSSLERYSFWKLLLLSLPRYVPLLVLIAVCAAMVSRTHRVAGGWDRHWEKIALAIGAVFGWLSFMAQGKPFLHHRYTMLVLLFLLIGFVLLEGLRERGWPRAIAIAGLLYALFWIVPMGLREVIHVNRQMPAGQVAFVLSLESDLQQLGGARTLQDKVQCFDLVYGCLNALNRMQIVENTSYTGDLLLFAKDDGPAAEYYRNKYWHLEKQDPASVIVMSNEWFQQKNSFNKVAMWPQFAGFLAQNYTLAVQREMVGQGDDPKNPDAYRIYVRKSSPLVAEAVRLRSASR